jgi:hypothetical protein
VSLVLGLRLEEPADGEEGGAEGAAGLVFGATRPEEVGEIPSGEITARVQEEKGEEGSSFWCGEGVMQEMTVLPDLKAPEEADREWRRVRPER